MQFKQTNLDSGFVSFSLLCVAENAAETLNGLKVDICQRLNYFAPEENKQARAISGLKNKYLLKLFILRKVCQRFLVCFPFSLSFFLALSSSLSLSLLLS